jgi:lipopolysaccharide biosynthesis glycosyltransferase
VILADRLSADAKNRIQRVAGLEKLECSIWDVDSSEFPYDCGLVHLSATTFTRLMLPRLLTGESRCVWIDCDMVVDRDVSSLADVDLHGHVIGAVRDQSRPTLESHGAIPYATAWPGWKGSEPFFNGGFLVFDLAAWRRLEIDSRVARFLSEYGGQLNAADQDVLNAVCLNAWQPLPFFWNEQGDRLRNDQAAAFAMSEQERHWIKQMIAGEPTILHFIGEFKPWNSGLFTTGYRGWMGYAAGTPYFTRVEYLIWRARLVWSVVLCKVLSRSRRLSSTPAVQAVAQLEDQEPARA